MLKYIGDQIRSVVWLVVYRLHCVCPGKKQELNFMCKQMQLYWFSLLIGWFQITQQLEGICLQVIGTVLQQHVLG